MSLTSIVSICCFDNHNILLVALERANGRKVDGRRVVVDYERGRTKQEWVPRRLGGGKGGDNRRRDREAERLIRELKKTEPVLLEKSRSRSKEGHTVKREEEKA